MTHREDGVPLEEKVRRSRWRKPEVWIGYLCAGLPFLAWGSCATGAIDENDGLNFWIGACLAALLGIVMGISTGRWPMIALGVLSPVATFFLGLLTSKGYSRGRALRRNGVARTPGERASEDWCTPLPSLRHLPEAVARGWRLNAATETASVAAFSHLANELMALGAPADLVAKAHEDALDEIRHARLCYGLAQAIDGRALGPDAFPYARRPSDGTLSLASLASDCIVESCLFESASAHVASALAARGAAEASIQNVLETIAADEAMHAEHGREIVTWCAAAGDRNVVAAMRAALASVDTKGGVAPVDDASFEHLGLAGPRLWLEAIATARTEVDELVLELEGRISTPGQRAATAA